MDLDEAHQPEWVQAGHFQLSLELKRQLAKQETGMSAKGKEKRDKLREKRAQKKLRNQAKKKLDADEREQIRATLQSKSRREAATNGAQHQNLDTCIPSIGQKEG